MRKWHNKWLAASALAILTQPALGAGLLLDFKNVPEASGKVMIAVYDSADSFRKEPVVRKMVDSTPGQMQVSFPDLQAGEYAVMVFHDQNGDRELNRNMMGIPKEPWSGSLNTRLVIGAPTWDQTRFILPEKGTAVAIDFK